MRVLIDRDDLANAIVDGVGRVTDEIQVERLELRPATRGFREFVNDGTIDLSEIALVTFLQAVAIGRPVGLVPVTTLGRFQHQTLISCGELALSDLAGARIGVRAWTQTTGVWVRGFLVEQYGVDLRSIDWLTYEGSHVDGYLDPAWVHRAPAGAQLVKDLLEKRIDGAIIGNDLPAGTPARPVISDPDTAAREWARMTGCVPVNHVVAVSLETASRHPDIICAAYDSLREVALAGHSPTSPDLAPVGFEALRGSLDRAAAYAQEQGILARAVGYEEIVNSVCDALGVAPVRLGG